MTRKTNTALIALLGTILMGLATWTLVTLIELQLISNNDPVGPDVY